MPDTPFNPLDKVNLAESLAEAMLRKPMSDLPPKEKFDGAGIYAIYYAGKFRPYRPLKNRNQGHEATVPIYVGKAVPPGARKGGFGLGADPGRVLLKRLNEHSKSIQEARNLDLDDFSCRYLVCDDIWIPLGEALLIERFQPLWNVLIQGFGIHTPGKGRKKQVKSMWDTLHPGRTLAKGLPRNPLTKAQLFGFIDDFFAGKIVPALSTKEAVAAEEQEEEQ